MKIRDEIDLEAIAKETLRPGDDLNMQAVKFDHRKIRWSLLPWDALEEVVKVLMFGASKYADRNWERGMDWDRLFDASMRHKIDWWQRGEELASDSHLKHPAHHACNALFLLAYELRNVGKDTRPK
jgi:Domain of unknown function (DUF5664)